MVSWSKSQNPTRNAVPSTYFRILALIPSFNKGHYPFQHLTTCVEGGTFVLMNFCSKGWNSSIQSWACAWCPLERTLGSHPLEKDSTGGSLETHSSCSYPPEDSHSGGGGKASSSHRLWRCVLRVKYPPPGYGGRGRACLPKAVWNILENDPVADPPLPPLPPPKD